MARKIGAVIALDGEQQFKNAVTACTKSLNNMKSALKLVETQTAGQKNSLEALQKKHDALNNVLGAAKAKQEAVAKEFEKSKRSYEDIGKKLDEYKDNLAEAKEKLEKMKASGEATDEELEKQEQAVAKAAEAVERAERSYESAGNRAEDWQRRLNDATTETTKAEQAVNENADAMEELEKATNDAGGELDDFADSADDAGDSAGEMEVSLKSMIKNAAVNVAVEGMKMLADGAKEAAKYVVQVGSDFEAGMSKVKAVSGASSKDMEQLSAKAKYMGATTKFSASEAADAMNYMAMAGWKTKDMLSGIEGIMNLAAASGEDLATTSDIVTDALTAFGHTAEDSGRLADIMAAASSNANTNVSMMGETFKFAAPVAGALGISMEDTALAVGLMANAGIKATQAGTALRGGLTNLVKPSKQAADAMEKYGIEIQKNDDGSVNLRATMEHLRSKFGELSETEQAAAAGAIFGKNAMSGWLAIINGSDEDFNKLADAIDNSDGAAKSMAETMGDNLQGKLTILQSSLEGMGIALYEKVASPLSGAVEFATGVVSDLTLALNPAKTDIETFLDDLQKSNKEVETSLQHAQETVSNAEQKVGELEAFGKEFDNILTDCDSFNAITLDDGRVAICNSTGEIVGYVNDVGTAATDVEGILDEWAAGGVNTSGISTTTEEAKNMIGYVSDKADTVETRLESFASQGIDTKPIEEGTQVIIQAFDDTGDEVETFTTDIDAAGKAEFDPKHIEGGTTAVITAFNSASGKVESFKGSIDAIANGEVSFSNLVSEWSKVEDSTKKTYHITDEFTKAKINFMIDTLGDSVGGLADAWNEETGELTASHKELKNWFNTAKDVAMYTALQDALKETYAAWGEASVNQIKAKSGYEAAKKALDDFVESSGKSVEQLETEANSYDVLGKSTSQQGQKYRELQENLMAASSEVETSNDNMAEAKKVMDETSEALQPYVDRIEELDQAASDAAGSTEDAAGATGELGDGLEEVDEQTQALIKDMQEQYKTEQNLRDISEEYKNKMIETFDAAKEAATIDIDPFGEWAKNAENGIAKFRESMQSQIDGMLAYKDNLSVVRDNLGEISPEFVGYLEDMGVGGAQLVEELAEAFRNGDASTAQELMGLYTQALDVQDDIATNIGLDQVKLMYELNEMGSSVAEWEGLGYAFDSAVEQIQEGGGQLAEETTTAFWAAVDAAKAAGVAIPAGLADSIANSEDPELAVQQATEQLNTAIWAQNEGILEVAQKAGVAVPEGLAQSIRDKSGDPEQAFTELVTLLGGKQGDFETVGTEAGEGMATSAATGIGDKEKDVTGAADSVVKSAKDTATTTSGLFRMVGRSGMEMFKSGMKDKESEVKESAVSIVSSANETAKLYGERVFEASGKSMGDSLANGIESATSQVTSKISEMTSQVQSKMSEMQSAVSNAMSGIASAVNNTYIHFPHIEIPHIRWDWIRITYGDGGWTEVPDFRVDWYAKAMDKGMILDSPTIFGAMNGKLLGAGEAGSETVVGTNSLMSMIDNAVRDAVAPEAAYDDVSRKLDSLINILGLYMPQVVDGMSEDKVFDADGSYMGKFRKKLSSEIAMDVRRARA
jgi:TP901 family phage tail tape measure protein